MTLLGAEMTALEPGLCEIRAAFREDLTQQHGFFHAGVTGAIVDSACGYAAFSLMEADCSVLTVEYKLNLTAPADGTELRARAQVTRPGKTLMVVTGEVFVNRDGVEKLCAVSLSTIMAMKGMADKKSDLA